MAVAQLDGKYTDVLDALIEAVRGEADAVLKGAQGDDKAFATGLPVASLAPADVRAAFSRAKIEEAYQKAYEGNTLAIATITALVMQSDTLAGVEKAYRCRHRTRLEFLVSGVSRARGLVADTGYLNHAMRKFPLLESTNA